MERDDVLEIRVQQLEEERLRKVVLDRTPRTNIELLDQTMEQIELGILNTLLDQPAYSIANTRHETSFDGWDQTNWRSLLWSGDTCTSSYCAAGWIGVIDALNHGGAGGPLYEDGEMTQENRPSDDNAMYLKVRDDDPKSHIKLLSDGTEAIAIDVRAQRVAGLTSSEARWLFDGSTNLVYLRGKFATLRAEELARRARAKAFAALEQVEVATNAAADKNDTPE
jgi:hypothetical protein